MFVKLKILNFSGPGWCVIVCSMIHDDVIKWRHFPRHWPFVREFPAQGPVMRSFDVFFDLRLNKRLSKQSLGWWFETPTRPIWRHRNGLYFHSWLCNWARFVQRLFLGLCRRLRSVGAAGGHSHRSSNLIFFFLSSKFWNGNYGRSLYMVQEP